MAKVTQTLARADGSEVRIIAEEFFGRGLTRSVDIRVHLRASAEQPWHLCDDRPHPAWRTMSVDEYVKHGRSEMLRTVTHGEILRVASMLPRI